MSFGTVFHDRADHCKSVLYITDVLPKLPGSINFSHWVEAFNLRRLL